MARLGGRARLARRARLGGGDAIPIRKPGTARLGRADSGARARLVVTGEGDVMVARNSGTARLGWPDSGARARLASELPSGNPSHARDCPGPGPHPSPGIACA